MNKILDILNRAKFNIKFEDGEIGYTSDELTFIDYKCIKQGTLRVIKIETDEDIYEITDIKENNKLKELAIYIDDENNKYHYIKR